MIRQSQTRLVPQGTESENQILELDQKLKQTKPEHKEPILEELDKELACPRCAEVMELNSSFDTLVYFCDDCSFILKCV
jgi:hypothetical protein